jgi:hypothetical protein
LRSGVAGAGMPGAIAELNIADLGERKTFHWPWGGRWLLLWPANW